MVIGFVWVCYPDKVQIIVDFAFLIYNATNFKNAFAFSKKSQVGQCISQDGLGYAATTTVSKSQLCSATRFILGHLTVHRVSGHSSHLGTQADDSSICICLITIAGGQ